MSFGFSYIGLIWLAMLLVPNFIWTKNKPKDYEKYAVNENKILLGLERAGEFIVTPVALLFSDFNYKGWNFWAAVLLLSFLCMVLYEIFWVRYFRSEKTMQDFYSSLCGVPVAGATYPVIAFALLGIYGGNILMLIGSVILGVGHIGIHLQHRKEVCGQKKKQKLVIRILKGIGLAVLALIFGTFFFFIAGRNINQLKRASLYMDGVNEQTYVLLNDQEEYVSICGRDVTNPVIISLHGGPGSPTTFVDYLWQDRLTDQYTVIAWDERGCGRSYYRNTKLDPDNVTLSFEQQILDLDALVDYALERFGQEKVIILGHSYGTMLGSRYALSHSEKVSAYIGVGQCVNEEDYYGEFYSYEDALKKAQEKGDDTTKLTAAYEKFKADMSIVNLMNLRALVEPYHPLTYTKGKSTMAALTSPIAGVDDMRWYFLTVASTMGNPRHEQLIRPLEEYMKQFNVLSSGDSYEMPVLLISGTCDWITPYGLVQDYAAALKAPKVEVCPIEGCGHSPQGQVPDEFAEAVKRFLGDL